MFAKEALQHLKNCVNVKAALEAELQADDRCEERQLSISDFKGNTAAFTGTKPDGYKSHIVDKDFIVAGKIAAP